MNYDEINHKLQLILAQIGDNPTVDINAINETLNDIQDTVKKSTAPKKHYFISNLYSIRDDLAQNFGPPFESNNHSVAIRTFENLIRNATRDSSIGQNPNDFSLYFIAELNKDTGSIISKPPVRLITGSDIYSPQE